jgi:tRNA threonylcarbamoyladenosine biosynthesis protein TsaB
VTLLVGIDTATIGISVALDRDGTVVGESVIEGARRQTELLHPALADLFSSTGWVPDDLDAVVVDVGPGRFTGVRVGVAAAKALAFAVGVPTVGCLSTEILLEGSRAESDDVVAVVDLRRGEVAVLFSGDDPVQDTVRTTPEKLGAMLVARNRTGALLVGDGAVEYRSMIELGAGSPCRIGGGALAVPSAAAACRIAGRDLSARSVDPLSIEPVYLRGADVRLGWATRSNPADPVRMEVG